MTSQSYHARIVGAGERVGRFIRTNRQRRRGRHRAEAIHSGKWLFVGGSLGTGGAALRSIASFDTSLKENGGGMDNIVGREKDKDDHARR